MVRLLRHILFALVAFALVGGTTSDFARAAAYSPVMAAMDAPCDMAMPMSASGDDAKPMPPCKGLTADCIKQMGCVTVVGLPVPFTARETAVKHAAVTYWPPLTKLVSFYRQPEPQPPRTA